MWLDNLEANDDWTGVWKGRIVCGSCRGLITERVCPICDTDRFANVRFKIEFDGKHSYEVPQQLEAGALDLTNYLLLELMQKEWQRPFNYQKGFFSDKIPEKIMIVILFWSHFEILMDRFFTDALRISPEKLLTIY